MRSYMTTTPSALRKNCWVMQRYLRKGPGQVRCLFCRHSPPPRGEERRGYPGGGAGGAILTSPAPPCPTAAGPPASRPHARSSCGNRCLWGEPSIRSKSGTHARARNPISPRAWLLVLSLPLTGCGTLIQSRNLSGPQAAHCSVIQTLFRDRMRSHMEKQSTSGKNYHLLPPWEDKRQKDCPQIPSSLPPFSSFPLKCFSKFPSKIRTSLGDGSHFQTPTVVMQR